MDRAIETARSIWRRLPGVAKAIIVIGAIVGGTWGQGAYARHGHDKRLVAIYCGDRPHCADNVNAGYVREGRTGWAREAMRIQDAEDEAREEACPGGPAANGGC
jgi:hypothetical protein